MSADLLRRAAALMRDRATRAEALRFWPSDDHDGMDETYTWAELVDDLPGDDGLNTFVASWHPAVALAVADWLEHATTYTVDPDDPDAHEPTALAVATAYLGEA